jgi:hypothetical protein
MSKLSSLSILGLAYVITGCTSNLAGHDPGHDASPDTQTVVQATGGCSGTAKVGASEVPAEHRATAAACAPSRNPLADGGFASCTSDADCAFDGGLAAFSTCLHGSCTFDHCLTDADCSPTEVCACSSDYYGGNTAFHGNVCVPANCHVDGDCGPVQYCSPSRGRCGSFLGFYCHTSKDSCVDATKDCGTCGNSCVYAPTAGAFVCGSVVCNG